MNKKTLKKLIPIGLPLVVVSSFAFTNINQTKQSNPIKANIEKLTDAKIITKYDQLAKFYTKENNSDMQNKVIEKQKANELNSLDSIKKSEYYKVVLEYLRTNSVLEQLETIFKAPIQKNFHFDGLEKNTLNEIEALNLFTKADENFKTKLVNFDLDITQEQLNLLTLIFDDDNKNASISKDDKIQAKTWFSTKFENHFSLNNFKTSQSNTIKNLLQQRKDSDENILRNNKANFKSKIIIDPTFRFRNGLFVGRENIITDSHKILNNKFVSKSVPNVNQNDHLSVSEIVITSVTTNTKKLNETDETLENIGKTITINYQINYNNASIIDSKIYQNEQTISLTDIYDQEINSYKENLSKLNLKHNPESEYFNAANLRFYKFTEQDFLINPVPLSLPNFSAPLVSKFVSTEPPVVTNTKAIVPTTYQLNIPAHKFYVEHKEAAGLGLKEIKIDEYNSPISNVIKNVEFPINIINQVNEDLIITASKKGNKTLPVIVEKIFKNISLPSNVEAVEAIKKEYFKFSSNFDFENEFQLQIDNITKANNASGTLKLFYTISKRGTELKEKFFKIVSNFLKVKYLDIKDGVDIDVNNTYDSIGGHGSTEKNLPNDKRFGIFAQAIINVENENPKISEQKKRALIKSEYEKLLNAILLGGTFKKELIDNIKKDQEKIQKDIEKLGIDPNSLAKFKELVKNNQVLIDLINKAQSFEDIKKALDLVHQLQKNFTLNQIKTIIQNADSVKKFISNTERYSLYVIGGFTLLSSILLLSISFRSLLKSKITKKNLLISKKTIFTVSFSLAIVSIAIGSYAIIEAVGGINV